ncbi:MAG TPA: hypothetical protein EYQ20_03335 [candidate division Zixibacteria bacterium]|nr:hypothetical protein [candidate division Zixibacteria bacterium]
MDEFYKTVIPDTLSDDGKSIRRQAFAGLLWGKQFYRYVVQQWIEGMRPYHPPADERKHGRNHQRPHLFNRVIKQDRPVLLPSCYNKVENNT